MDIQRIGKYSYSGPPLVQDSAGTLYEGMIPDTGESVYVKKMRTGDYPDRASSNVSLQGIESLQSITHPALARVLGAVGPGRECYVVVSRPEGELLRDSLPAMSQGGLWGRWQLLTALVDVCGAVEALHHDGLAHGAITPSTIVIRQEVPARACLLCFQPLVSRSVNEQFQGNGELVYLAQEQLRGRGGFASDVYALGILLYVGFGSGMPFMGESLYELAESIVWGDFAPFQLFLDDLDSTLQQVVSAAIKDLGSVVRKALQRDPEKRYATVAELRAPLEQMAQRLSPIALGRQFYQQKQLDLAIKVLEGARTIPAVAVDANTLLGRIYGFELDDYAKGVIAFKRVLKQAPWRNRVRLELIRLYVRYERINLANREVLIMLEKRPDDLQTRMQYAEILHQAGHWQETLGILREVQGISPYHLPAYASAIRIGLAQEDLGEAEDNCNRAMDRIVKVIDKGNLEPDQVAEIYYLRGILWRRRGRNEQAIRWSEKALEQSPWHRPSHQLLAELYDEAGQVENAMRHRLISLGLNPNQER